MPFVRATCDFETATHTVTKGQLVDLPVDQADAVVKRGDAVRVSVEDAIASMSGAVTATATHDAAHRKVR